MIRPGLLLIALLAGAVHAQDIELPDYERVTLDNGTVLILNRHPEVPLIGVEVVLKGGAIVDPDGASGTASLFAGMLDKGAGGRDAAAFADTVDAHGGSLTASAGIDSIRIRGEFLSRDAALVVELLSDMLIRPALDSAEFERLKSRSINLLRAAKDSDPIGLLPVYGAAFLFGEHAYGNPVAGSEATLAGISLPRLRYWYRDEVGADRLIVSVSGDIDVAAMRAALTEAFAGFRPAANPMPAITPAAPVEGRRVLLVDKPGATQTWFWLGNVGVAADYRFRAELDIANTLFGGRFTSMLNKTLRVESGLTYYASAALVRPELPGSVAITSFTQTDRTVEAIDTALETLGRLHGKTFGKKAIKSAQTYVLGHFPTRFETAAQIAGELAWLAAYGFGDDYVEGYADAVLAAEPAVVDSVVDQVYPTADNLAVVLIGDAARIRDAIASYGPVTEMSITEPRFRP